MRMNLICIGKTDDKEIRNLISYYLPRLPKHWNFEMTELPDVKSSKNSTADHFKKEEGRLFLQHLEPGDWNILLDEKGKQYTSREFASKLDRQMMNSSIKRINFLIGGAYGFSEEIYQKAQEKISLSRMTFTHQMVRLFIVEQFYRAHQILSGKPYHND
ncbi:23S rRNA (pseudouridine(1915)-N(3))-methyltransferase RlmH [Daejeonia sp. YH14]|uniref:23S rRNA (pseudouridine(1915)-N(3))-methyltransferase RlmH n=1 Tax=Daejeonia sp. YH14 TaxID=3439042 RepID=UPI003F4991C3